MLKTHLKIIFHDVHDFREQRKGFKNPYLCTCYIIHRLQEENIKRQKINLCE